MLPAPADICAELSQWARCLGHCSQWIAQLPGTVRSPSGVLHSLHLPGLITHAYQGTPNTQPFLALGKLLFLSALDTESASPFRDIPSAISQHPFLEEHRLSKTEARAGLVYPQI